MQPEYAPELNVVGAVLGAPERGLGAALEEVNDTPFAGLIPAAFAAIGKDDPAFAERIRSYSTPDGRARIDETANHCVAQNGLSNLWFDFGKYFTQSMDAVLRDPVIHKALAERGISGKVPTAPVYVYNGVTDEVSPIASVDELVSSYCHGGTPVTYRRCLLYTSPSPRD